MSNPIIKVDQVFKKFIIAHEEQEKYKLFRDVVADKARNLIGRGKKGATTREEFYALKDVSFDIQAGDRVGIIGRNGAGKSTLLKVLSRITEPTSGRITIRGRIASLLEVGTGFHPELSGRENIFLNGAILGMSRAEIRRKFDEIVAFAEVEKFLDTPVKRYSSGMYVRLAFSVAAHLEPEILIVDEVLAVGDAQFQKKCLGKMEDVSAKEGRTVLFVSHNTQAIVTLCNRGIYLQNGVVLADGDARTIIDEYYSTSSQKAISRSWDHNEAPGNKIVSLLSIRIVNSSSEGADYLDVSEDVGIEMKYVVKEEGHILWHGINCFNVEGLNVFDSHSVTGEYYNKPHPKGEYIITAWIPKNLLSEGTYVISAAIFNHVDKVLHLHERDVVSFSMVDDVRKDKVSARGMSPGYFPGIVRPLLNWKITK